MLIQSLKTFRIEAFFYSCPSASSANNQSDLLKSIPVLLVSFLTLQWAYSDIKNKIQIPCHSLTDSISEILIPGSALVSSGELLKQIIKTNY